MTVVVESFGQEIYDGLEPLAYDDASQGSALLTLCGALGAMFQPIRTLVRADDQGNPGWSLLLDITRCPTANLPYLGQFVGVQVDPSLDDAQQRLQISQESGMARGTVGAITAAAQKYLTGSQTVIISERDPDAYSFTVTTFTDETPDSDVVEAALEAAKPAGLILVYTNVAGQTWGILKANEATWADVISTFSTWTDVINNTP